MNGNNNVYPNQMRNNNTYPNQMQNNNAYPNQMQNNNAYPNRMQNNNVYPNQMPNYNAYPNQMQNNNMYPNQMPNNMYYNQMPMYVAYPVQYVYQDPYKWNGALVMMVLLASFGILFSLVMMVISLPSLFSIKKSYISLFGPLLSLFAFAAYIVLIASKHPKNSVFFPLSVVIFAILTLTQGGVEGTDGELFSNMLIMFAVCSVVSIVHSFFDNIVGFLICLFNMLALVGTVIYMFSWALKDKGLFRYMFFFVVPYASIAYYEVIVVFLKGGLLIRKSRQNG